MARQFRAALDLPLILLGGITRLDTMTEAIGEGFAFVALGRALLREPDLPASCAGRSRAESLCIHCNKCMPSIYQGTHCVLVAPPDRPGLRLGRPGSGALTWARSLSPAPPRAWARPRPGCCGPPGTR